MIYGHFLLLMSKYGLSSLDLLGISRPIYIALLSNLFASGSILDLFGNQHTRCSLPRLYST